MGTDSIEKWANLQHKFDWHTGFFRQLFFSFSPKKNRDYGRFNIQLLTSIKTITGCKLIIDSSKYAGRALALNRITKGKILIICLTRSPKGLIHSFRKSNQQEQKPKSPLKALLYYIAALLSLRMTCNRLGSKVHQLHYEELISDPIDALKKIELWARIDLSDAKQYIKHNQPLDPGHIVTGNRLRNKKKIIFKPVIPDDNFGFYEMGIIGLMKIWQRLLRFE
jgi:hypothetical protein